MEKGFDAVTPEAATKGLVAGAAAASGVLDGTPAEAPASGPMAMAKGEGWKSVVGSVAPMAGGSGAAVLKGEDVVVAAWDAGMKGLTPKGEGGMLPRPGALGMLEAATGAGSGAGRLAESNCANLCVGSATSRASFGATGVWNITGQARKISNSGTKGLPLRKAWSRMASGIWTDCAGGAPVFFATSDGRAGSRSPIVSPAGGEEIEVKGLTAGVLMGWPGVGGASTVLKRKLPAMGAAPGLLESAPGGVVGVALRGVGEEASLETPGAAPVSDPPLPKKLRRENAMVDTSLP